MHLTKDCCRILVTGGCGFIGHHLVTRLLNLGHHIIVLDNLSTGSHKNLPKHQNLTFYEGSVLDSETVIKAGTNCDLVFHLASLVGKALVTQKAEEAFQISFEGAKNLINISQDLPIVLFSSSAVYGLDPQSDFDETQTISPDWPLSYDGGQKGYAVGKWQMELLAQSHPEYRTLTIRPFNVVGPRQTAHYGMVIPKFVRAAKSGQDLIVYDNGQQTRCFTHVGKFVDILIQIVSNKHAWKSPIINIGTPHETAIETLAQKIIHHTKSSSKICYKPYHEVYPSQTDVFRRVPNLTRLESILGSITWPSIQTIIQEVCQDVPTVEICR